MDQIRKVAVVPVELEADLYKSKTKTLVKKSKKDLKSPVVKVIKVNPKWKIVK